MAMTSHRVEDTVRPDFFHRVQDVRAVAEFCEGDQVVFANKSEEYVQKFTFDDSQHF